MTFLSGLAVFLHDFRMTSSKTPQATGTFPQIEPESAFRKAKKIPPKKAGR
jgi:hypothetical protein